MTNTSIIPSWSNVWLLKKDIPDNCLRPLTCFKSWGFCNFFLPSVLVFVEECTRHLSCPFILGGHQPSTFLPQTPGQRCRKGDGRQKGQFLDLIIKRYWWTSLVSKEKEGWFTCLFFWWAAAYNQMVPKGRIKGVGVGGERKGKAHKPPPPHLALVRPFYTWVFTETRVSLRLVCRKTWYKVEAALGSWVVREVCMGFVISLLNDVVSRPVLLGSRLQLETTALHPELNIAFNEQQWQHILDLLLR